MISRSRMKGSGIETSWDSRILESTFASLDDALFIVDPNTRIVLRCNPAVERIFGCRVEEIVGRTTEFLHLSHETFEQFGKEIFRALESGGVIRTEFKMRRKSGEEFHTEHTVSQILNTAGKRIGIVSIVRDITLRRQAEKALKESERKYRNIVETAEEGIWVVDSSSRTTFLNSRMAEMLGYPIEEIEGRSLFQFMDEKERRKAEKLINGRKKSTRESHEFFFQRKDGSDLYALVVTNPLLDDQGGYIGALAMVTDITKRKKMEENLIQSEKQLHLLVKRLSGVQELEARRITLELHDQVGQLISVIGMDLRLLREYLPKGAPEKFLDRLDAASDRVEELGQHVRNFIQDLRPNSLDDQGLLAGIQDYARRFSQRTGIETEILGNPGNVREYLGLEISLFRIAQEALVNINKHAKASKVVIRFEHLGKNTRLTISDNGCGFDPAQLGNSGIGVVGMRERAEAVGAKFRVESSPGQGTQIKVDWRI